MTAGPLRCWPCTVAAAHEADAALAPSNLPVEEIPEALTVHGGEALCGAHVLELPEP